MQQVTVDCQAADRKTGMTLDEMDRFSLLHFQPELLTEDPE